MLQIVILFAVASIILGFLEKLREPKRKQEGCIGEAENEILRIKSLRKIEESLNSSVKSSEKAEQAEVKKNLSALRSIYEAENLKPETKQSVRNEKTELKTVPEGKQRLDPYSFTTAEKPIVAHSTADCTGGSIHDGYHEGTFRKPTEPAQREGAFRKPTEPAQREGAMGKQGRKLKGRSEAHEQGVLLPGENHSVSYAPESMPAKQSKPNAHVGADKLVAAIAKKPSIVQGIIWSEVIGKPKSEIS